MHAGPGCHTTLGFLPTGLPWGHGERSGHGHGRARGFVGPHSEFTATLYYNLRHDDLARWKADGLEAWKARCVALMPKAERVIETLERPEQVAFASYSDGIMWRFNAGRVVCIGDVAHSMSPQLGQGARAPAEQPHPSRSLL